MYLDSAYIAKFYVNETDAAAVRKLIRGAAGVCSSSWALVEVTAAFHRHVREGSLTAAQGRELTDVFRRHVESDLWNLVPVSDALLRRAVTLIRGLPQSVPLRAGDAIHLATALDAGEPEIWTIAICLRPPLTSASPGGAYESEPNADVLFKTSA